MAKASDTPVMSTAAQRVVIIEDASREVSSSAVKWALDGSSLQPGDELTLVGILHQVNNPSTLSFIEAGNMCKTSMFIS